MASQLEKSTELAKKLGIGCLILIVLVLVINFIVGLFKQPEPPYDPYPKYAQEEFGTLPALEFESLPLTENSSPEYKIETTDGKLPDLPPIVFVYQTKTPRQSLTAEDDANEIAKSLNFQDESRPISDTEVEWTQGGRVLTINKLYNTVTIRTAYQRLAPEDRTNEIEPYENSYISSATSYLKQAGLFPANYQEDNLNSLIYLKLNSDFELIQAKSAQDADFVRVDFFQNYESVGVTIPPGSSDKEKEKYESYRIYSQTVLDNPYEGAISIVIGSTSNKNKIYELSYTDWELEDRSTHYLIDENEAWEQVQKGNGYIRTLKEVNSNPFAGYTPQDIKSFLLTDVEIVYLFPKTYNKYIQPIYQFSGIAKRQDSEATDLEFNIYYPAVKQEE